MATGCMSPMKPNDNLRPDLRKEQKELASGYYHLFSGHASTRAYVAEKIRNILSSECQR